MRLEGKVALITGGSRGIGRAVAVRFAQEGANIVVNYCSHASEAQRVVEQIRACQRSAVAVKADVSDSLAVREMVMTAIDSFSRIDILVNSAGVIFYEPFLETDEDHWDKVIDVNLKGTFLCSQAVARAMVAGHTEGKIVNLSSTAGKLVYPKGGIHYAASKGGVISLTKAMAVSLAPHRITVNAVAPGVVETDMTLALLDHGGKESRLRRIPLGRVATLPDITEPILFLASGDSAYITGQTLFVDGGWTVSATGVES